MKTVRNFTLFVLHFTLAFATANAKTFDVDISTGRPAASNEAYYHGETIEFRAVRGRSVVTNVEYSCVYYQTNGMDSVWWKTDGLVFHPTNDVGAANYRFFLEGRDNLGRDWHANGLLRLLPSPGFTPNPLPLPVESIDFSRVVPLNAPWLLPDATNATLLAALSQVDELGSSVASNAAAVAALEDTTSALSDSIPSVALTNETLYVNGQSIELGHEGGTNVTLAVDSVNLTVATNGVPVWTSGATSEKRVAMFIVPVNEGSPFTYKGFELKCSTNNFASAASESVKLQFYSQSEIADEGSGSTIDKMRLFACTSYFDDPSDRRSYSPIGNTIDYHNDLYSVVVIVDVSCLKRHPEGNGAWLSEDNEDLVWCYLRDTANDVEREELTTEPLWRPIAPVKWFKEVPKWAR